MSSTSNASLSGSSAAANTVVVTARDIEFSNYNSSTGKWGNAVMTMMIMDAVTEELEGYSEKVYATFRNHVDPTDIITFSAEIDGLDTRVTTSSPMVASAKYELYKVYGETSGDEYATSSQFYIQVPGKLWDFANDTVDHDVSLISDWFNYGEVEDTDGNVYGMTTQSEAVNAVLTDGTENGITVNGVNIGCDQIYRIKLTSMCSGNFVSDNRSYFLYNMHNLSKIDFVSTAITLFAYRVNNSTLKISNCMRNTNVKHRFAMPATLTGRLPIGKINNDNDPYDQPFYIPDGVTETYHFMQGNSTYNRKVRFSPIFNGFHGYTFSNTGSFNQEIHWENLPRPSFDSVACYYWGYNHPVTIPASWGTIPQYFMRNWYQWKQESIVIPEGITSIEGNNFSVGYLQDVTLPSTLTSIGNNCFSITTSSGNTPPSIIQNPHKFRINLEDTAVTRIGSNCFTGIGGMVDHFVFPSTLKTIGNSCLQYIGFPDQTNIVVPEGVTNIGTSFLAAIWPYGGSGNAMSLTVTLPSTLASIGTGFLSGISNFIYFGNGTLVVDLQKASPDAFPDNDISSFSWFSQSNDSKITVKVAPGTKEIWENKYPNILIPSGSQYINAYRHIEWVEPTTEYGKLVYYPNYTTTWGVSSSAGTEPDRDAEIYDVEEFENWIGTLSPAPRISATGDLRFDSPNGEDLQYTDINGDTQTIQFGVWEIRGASLNFDYSAPEKYVVFNNNATVSTVDKTSTAEVELISMAQYNSLCMSKIPYIHNTSPVTDMTTRVTVGADSTVIPIACIKSYEFGTVPTTIPNYFLVASGIESVNMRYADITTIGDGFLCGCGYFNSNVDLTGVTSVGTDFLSKCVLFNGTLGDMSSLTAIGTRFLYVCQSFNQPVQLPSVITSLDSFMTSCYAFNQPLDFSHITTIGDNVLYGCRAFNYPLDLSNVTSVGDYFLANCIVYNQPVTIANVTTVGNSFLRGCSTFNSQVLLPNCTTFGNSFMAYCTIFNQPINMTNITNCGAEFLMSCKAFNQPLDLNNLVDAGTASVYHGFLNHCDAFNQTLNLPKIRYFGGLNYMASFNSDVTFGPNLAKLSNGTFAYNDKMCKTYNFGTVNPNNVQITNNFFDSLFTTTNSSTDAYVNGVKIAGTYRSTWMSKCPNHSSGYYIRKLVNAGY